jgi:hypothetical protein
MSEDLKQANLDYAKKAALRSSTAPHRRAGKLARHDDGDADADEPELPTKPYLTRPEAAAHLTDRGLPITKSTLQKLACIGGGPAYFRFGNRCVYRPETLDAWAVQKLGSPRSSASDEAA